MHFNITNFIYINKFSIKNNYFDKLLMLSAFIRINFVKSKYMNIVLVNKIKN